MLSPSLGSKSKPSKKGVEAGCKLSVMHVVTSQSNPESNCKGACGRVPIVC
jgi:hypothetical protein